MVTLRELETNKLLNELTYGAFSESVKHIVGVQFRNLATVGGSVFGRYGFSDIITLLVALNAEVQLYAGKNKTFGRVYKRTCRQRHSYFDIHTQQKAFRRIYVSEKFLCRFSGIDVCLIII